MGARLTLRRAWESYEAANLFRVRSLATDRGRIEHVLGFFGKATPAATLTFKDVDSYRRLRRGEITIRKSAPSAATLNREIELLARILAFAVSRKLLAVNPLASVEYEPEDNVRQVVVKEELLGQVLAACRGWLRPFVLLAIDSGMRRTEIVKLRWSQVDEKAGLIDLAAVDTKTRQPRTTILSDRARAAIAELPRAETWVFTNPRTGKHYDPAAVTQCFRKAMVDAGITAADGREIWLHDCRRTFVTQSRRSGIAETVVMKMTGHRTPSVFERYNIRDRGDLLRAREVLEGTHAGHRVHDPMGVA
jgi:integrase